MRIHIIITVVDIPNSSIFRTLICSRKIWSRDVAKQTEPEDERAVKKGNGGGRKKREECKMRKEESMFPKKKSSRERSRLGLPSWRNTRSSLILSFSLLSSARLPASNQLRTFAAFAFLYLFFLSLAPQLRVRVEGKRSLFRGLSSPEYLDSPDYRQFPSCMITLWHASQSIFLRLLWIY